MKVCIFSDAQSVHLHRIVAGLVMFGILLSDILYAIVDPRISYS